MASVTVAEEVEEPDDDGDHRERTDPADGAFRVNPALIVLADVAVIVTEVVLPTTEVDTVKFPED